MQDVKPEYTTGQAAEILRVSRRTALRMVKRGDLRATRRGNRWCIPLVALMANVDQWDSAQWAKRLGKGT
jgi:excisionase family DNA binding protein